MTTCCYINSGQSNFEFEYIGEFETEFKTILEYESGAQVGSIGRKKQRAKISCYCPFKDDKHISVILLNLAGKLHSVKNRIPLSLFFFKIKLKTAKIFTL